MGIEVSQNFLKNPDLVTRLVQTAGIMPGDLVLDIGAGRGIITNSLLSVGAKVIAIELDPLLYKTLANKYSINQKVTVINQDILKYTLPKEKYKVFSNLPFNLTTEVIHKLINHTNPPEDCWLIVQKEAALRYQGAGEGTLVSLLIYPWFETSVEHEFSSDDFTPIPAVNPVLFRFKKRVKPLVNTELTGVYRDFICHVLVSQKTNLKNRLKKVFMPAELYEACNYANVDPKTTSRLISKEQWLKLFEAFLTTLKGQYGTEKLSVIKNSYKNYLMKKDMQEKITQSRKGIMRR